jgi:hypothetical protein
MNQAGDLTEYFMWMEVDERGREGVVSAFLPEARYLGLISIDCPLARDCRGADGRRRATAQ